MQIIGSVRDAGSGGGLPGVPVCNGESFVLTGDDGGYELAVEPGGHAFAWISVPDLFLARNRFYHGLLDIGSSEEEHCFDFELVRRDAGPGEGFRLAHVTDLHLVVDAEIPNVELASPAALERAVQHLVGGADPDLIIIGGDLTNLGTLQEMAEVHQVLSRVDKPVFPMFGNHDGGQERRIQLAREGKADATFTRHYERFFGPPYYSFDWGGRHFLLHMDFDRCLSAADQARKANWLEADLARQPSGRPIVVVLHGPPSSDLLAQLSRFNVSTVLYGHRHASKVFRQGSMDVICTPAFCFGGSDTAPASYRLLDFGGTATGASVTNDASRREESVVEHQLVTLHSERLNTRATIGSTAPRSGLELIWERQLPGQVHRAAPTIHRNRLFLSVSDENLMGGAGVICLDAADGRELWRFRCDASIKNSVVVSDSGVCAGVSVHGEVYLLDAASGDLLWRSRLPGHPDFFIYTAPLISSTAVYVLEKGLCAALSLDRGELLWSRSMDPRDQGQTGFRRGVSGRDVPSFTGFRLFRHLLVGLIPGRGLVGMRSESGEIEWEVELEGGKQAFAVPVLSGDSLISGGAPDELVAVDAASGAIAWRRTVLEGGFPAGLAVGDGRIYAASFVGGLRCFDQLTGDLRWQFETGEDLLDMIPRRRGLRSILAPPMTWNQHLILGANDGVLYFLDSATGECRERIRMGAPVTSAPCLTNHGFCVRTWDGRLVSLQSTRD